MPIPLTLKPMEAEPVDDLPRGKGWLYEPKYDGFRCIAFRDSDKVDLQSKKQKSLNRFFPEVAAGHAGLEAERFPGWRRAIVLFHGPHYVQKPAKAAGFLSPALATPAKRIPAARAP